MAQRRPHAPSRSRSRSRPRSRSPAQEPRRWYQLAFLKSLFQNEGSHSRDRSPDSDQPRHRRRDSSALVYRGRDEEGSGRESEEYYDDRVTQRATRWDHDAILDKPPKKEYSLPARDTDEAGYFSALTEASLATDGLPTISHTWRPRVAPRTVGLAWLKSRERKEDQSLFELSSPDSGLIGPDDVDGESGLLLSVRQLNLLQINHNKAELRRAMKKIATEKTVDEDQISHIQSQLKIYLKLNKVDVYGNTDIDTIIQQQEDRLMVQRIRNKDDPYDPEQQTEESQNGGKLDVIGLGGIAGAAAAAAAAAAGREMEKEAGEITSQTEDKKSLAEHVAFRSLKRMITFGSSNGGKESEVVDGGEDGGAADQKRDGIERLKKWMVEHPFRVTLLSILFLILFIILFIPGLIVICCYYIFAFILKPKEQLRTRSASRRYHDQEADENLLMARGFGDRLKAAIVSVLGLIGPMLIMAIDPSRKKSLIVVSVFVFVFAVLLAVRSTAKQHEVLAGVAGYAAVLVVFTTGWQ